MNDVRLRQDFCESLFARESDEAKQTAMGW